MLERVAYVTESTLFERDFERYGLNHFAARGVEVVVCDLTRMFHPALATREEAATGSARLLKAGTQRELSALVPELAKADLIVNLVGYTGSIEAIRAYRAIARAGRPSLAISTNAHPSPHQEAGEKGVFERLGDLRQRIRDNQFNPLNSLTARLPLGLLGVGAPDFIVYSGEESKSGAVMYPLDATTREIHAHTMDYEFVLRAGRDAPADGTAVFLDQSIGFHRDWVAYRMEPPEPVETYYPLLRGVFDHVEKTLGLDVVVAANPRAEYDDPAALFGPRRIEAGKSSELVRRASLVIGHRSTALGMAVMFDKPALVLGTHKMMAHWTDGPGIRTYAEALGVEPRMMDDGAAMDLSNVLEIDRERYDAYLRDYVKLPDSPELPFWEIVEAAVAGV